VDQIAEPRILDRKPATARLEALPTVELLDLLDLNGGHGAS
jgi:hypothetical protein